MYVAICPDSVNDIKHLVFMLWEKKKKKCSEFCQFCISVAADDCIGFIYEREESLNSQTEHKHQVNRGRKSSPRNPEKKHRDQSNTTKSLSNI